MAKQITKISFHEAGAKGVAIGYKNFGEQGLKDVTNKECKGQPANDFQHALQAFVPHLLFLCELQEITKFKEVPDAYAFENYRVCGVTITGADDKEGIMITGYKTLSTGKGFAFNTPNMKFSEEYQFMDELEGCWTKLKEEADAYLGGKYAVQQLKLDVGQPAPQEAA